MHPRFDALARRGKEFLGVDYPIICGAMTWVSDARLVAAVGNHGGFGLLAAGNLPPEKLEDEIARARDLTDKPFGVNLITIAPNSRKHLEIACRTQCPYIVFAGALPDGPSVRKAKESGARTMSFATTESVAKRMIKFGVDALVLEGYEAGGHIGPISSLVLIQEVLFRLGDQVPIFIAGGIATGKMAAHLMLMGAAGVQMGTRFVMAEECCVHPAFKEAFRKARARDAVPTPSFDSRLPVIPVRALKNKSTDEFKRLQLSLIKRLDERAVRRLDALHEVESFWVGALRKAVQDGEVDRGSLMAGQSVGLVDRVQPMKAIFDEVLAEAEAELETVAKRLAQP